MKQENFAKCSLARALNVVGSKWTLPIVYVLSDGPARFNDLQKALKIGPRTLSLRLSQLEKEGIIERRQVSEPAQCVLYQLTAKGKSLEKIIASMCAWGETTST